MPDKQSGPRRPARTSAQQSMDVEELKARLIEAESTLEAIRTGAVDAVVVNHPDGEKIYTLTGAEESYRVILEELNEGAATLTEDGVLVYANTRLGEMLSVKPEELLGTAFASWVTPYDADKAESMLYLEGTGSEQVEIALRRPGGSTFPALFYVTRLPKGQPASLAVIIVDQTKQKNIEKQLRFHSQILDAVGDAVMASDLDGTIRYWNRAAGELYGWKPYEVIGQSMLEVISTEMNKQDAQRIMEVILQGRSWSGELDMRRKDGSTFPAHLTHTPVFNREGQVIGVVGVSRDRTAELQELEAEREISRKLALHSKVLENVGDAIVVTRADNQIMYVNLAAQDLYGNSPEEMIGRDFREILDVSVDEEQTAKDNRRVEANEPIRGNYTTTRKNGESLPVYVVTAPLHDSDGTFIGTVNIVRDRSEELKRLELEKEAARREVHFRSLKTREEERARFAQMVAHEVNNPITPIRIQLHMLKTSLGEGSSPRLRRSIDIIERNINRTSLLLQDMLDVARIQSHRLKLDPQDISLRVVLEQCADDLRDDANRHNVQITTTMDEELTAKADSDRLAQVFLNLVGNALKFTPEKGMIQILAARHEDHIEIRVVDDGPGIDIEDAERVFQPFEQVGDHKKGGSGLGLYISKGIIEAHGGSLSCEPSPPNKGAMFVICLPLVATSPLT